MVNKNRRVQNLVLAAGLAAFSAVVQLVHVGYQSPQFGMWIDIVAVTWVVAYLLFGMRMSLVVSIVGALIITLFAPDTWLGALMKLLASVPMWLIPGLWLVMLKKNLAFYEKAKNLIFPVVVALVLRCALVIPVNYYFAIPIWTGMTPQKAMMAIPWYVIALFNIIQGLIDVYAAWILVYKFKIKRFASAEK